MLAVTIRTARRAGGSQGMTHAMDAGGVLFGGLIVAGGTVDRLGRHVVIRVFARDVRMATGARIGVMHRGREFRLVDKQPDRLARSFGLVQSFIRVAFQARGVGIFVGSKCVATAEEQGREEY